jgi:hypothetical protein
VEKEEDAKLTKFNVNLVKVRMMMKFETFLVLSQVVAQVRQAEPK